jgi:tetratricopeptide (TPR) repeat protein
MTMQEGLPGFLGPRAGTSGRPSRDKAYFLNLLGDGHSGLGHAEAAIEAYRQAAEEFRAQGAQCSYALCLFKIADGHMSLGEPWHALGYLEACLPLLRDLGLTRHETLAQHQLDACQAELAGARLLGGRAGRPAACAGAQPSRPRDPARRSPESQAMPWGPGQALSWGQARRNTVAVSARQG